MKIEPNDNPHLVIGKLAQENEAQKSTIKILREEQDRLNNALLSAHRDAEALRQQQQRLDDNLQFTKGQLLSCRGANQTLKDKIYQLEMTIDVQTAQLNGHREANKVLEDKNKELEKLLKEEKEAYIRLKGLRHAANYGMGARQFEKIMLKLPSPRWVVCFYRNGLELGTITYTHSPSTSTLNMLQESLKASSWRLTYHHD